jgi:sugar phosphate isomerase/epimerase
MAGVSRREFLQTAGGASAALAFMATSGMRLNAAPLGLPIGSQTWPHRARIGTDGYAGLASLMKDMKAIGIDIVELISPSGEFKALTDGKLVRKILDDNGMKSPSAHFRGIRTPGNLPTLIEWGNAIGMTHMNMASMGGQVVKRTCDEYNKIGAITKKSGLQLMTHNEGFENSRLADGRLTYAVLLEYLDPDLVKMQFQMSSMRTIGDPVMYFTMYPGRFESAHLQGVDAAAGVNPPAGGRLTVRPTPGPTAAGARGGGGGGQTLAVGEDSVDWVKVFEAAKIGGLKHYFVEQSWDVTVRSVAFLKTLNVT